MGLDMRTKRAALKQLAPSYQRAYKKRKGHILNEFIALTGYTRGSSSWLLRNCGRRVVMRGRDGEQVILVGELRKAKRQRKPVYEEKVKEWLKWFWWLLGYPCGKRLVVMIRGVCPNLVSRLVSTLPKSSAKTGHFHGGVKLPPRRFATLR